MAPSAERCDQGSTRWGRWTGRGTLFRNSIAGVLATGADFASVVVMVSSGWFSVPVATFFGCVVGAVVNFCINRFWAFGSDLGYLRQAWRYGLVSASSAVLNAGLVALLLLVYSGAYQLVWAVARVLVFLFWNYPLHRHYVFIAASRGRHRCE